MSLLYLSVFGSVFGFSLYLSLIKNIGANEAAYVAIIMPLIALLVSTIFENLDLECKFSYWCDNDNIWKYSYFKKIISNIYNSFFLNIKINVERINNITIGRYTYCIPNNISCIS